jgi:hypothetical protein
LGICLAASLLASVEARAATKLIAVLPLDARMAQGWLSEAGRSSIEEMVRDDAANLLAPKGWTILTGDTMLQVLIDNGVDPAKCSDQTCHLTIAREINAEKFISGAVQFVDGEFTASIRLIDTQSARIVSTERLSGRSARELRDAFEPKAEGFFKRAGLLGPVVTAEAAQTQHDGTLIVVSTPPGATVVLDGESVGKTPLRRRVSNGTYDLGVQMEGFSPVWKSITVNGDRETVVSERMAEERGFVQTLANGYVQVVATPEEAEITIDGQKAGNGLQGPLTPGRHVVRAEAEGYRPIEQAVTVPNSGTSTATLTLQAALGELLVSVNLAAECEAQGTRLLVTPSKPRKVTLTAGEVHLTCRRQGYEDAIQVVNITPDETVVVPIVMSARDEPRQAMTEVEPGLQIEVRHGPREIQIASDTDERDLVIEPAKKRRNVPEISFDAEEPAVSWKAPSNPQRQSQVDPRSGLDFVWLQGNGCRADDVFCEGEKTLGSHTTVASLWMSKTPVTVAAYLRCVRAGGCETPSAGARCHWGQGRGNQPMNCVDWQQAKQFCEWTGGRLPNIEEWENAASAGRARWDDLAAEFRDDDSDGQAQAATAHADMSGQIWEWTATNSGTKKVLSKVLTSTGARSSSTPSHRFTDPLFQDETVGFRCAR